MSANKSARRSQANFGKLVAAASAAACVRASIQLEDNNAAAANHHDRHRDALSSDARRAACAPAVNLTAI